MLMTSSQRRLINIWISCYYDKSGIETRLSAAVPSAILNPPVLAPLRRTSLVAGQAPRRPCILERNIATPAPYSPHAAWDRHESRQHRLSNFYYGIAHMVSAALTFACRAQKKNN